MSYALDNIPLNWENGQFRKRKFIERAFYVSLIFAILVFFSFGIYFNRNDVIRPIFSAYALSPIILTAILVFLLPRTVARSLTVDQEGIHVTAEGATIDYSWMDVTKVTPVIAQFPRHGSLSWMGNRAANCVLVRLRGTVSNPAEVTIQEEFGVRAAVMASIIQAGMERWGGDAI